MYVIERVLSWYGLFFVAIISLFVDFVLYHVLVNKKLNIYIKSCKLCGLFSMQFVDQAYDTSNKLRSYNKCNYVFLDEEIDVSLCIIGENASRSIPSVCTKPIWLRRPINWLGRIAKLHSSLPGHFHGLVLDVFACHAHILLTVEKFFCSSIRYVFSDKPCQSK